MQLHAGQSRDGALFHHKLWSASFRSNLPGHVINRREVGLTGFFWRSANTDENHLSRANRFACIGGVGDLFILGGLGQDFFQVLFIDGNFAGIQLVDTVFINIGAENFVAGCGQSSETRSWRSSMKPFERKWGFGNES